MHVEDARHLLMIHPTTAPTSEPTIDDLTHRMAGAMARARRGGTYRGFHCCTGRGCKALSSNADLLIEGYVTNSLAVHYLAYHRADVPRGELAKVAALNGPDAEPTPEQLQTRTDA